MGDTLTHRPFQSIPGQRVLVLLFPKGRELVENFIMESTLLVLPWILCAVLAHHTHTTFPLRGSLGDSDSAKDKGFASKSAVVLELWTESDRPLVAPGSAPCTSLPLRCPLDLLFRPEHS